MLVQFHMLRTLPPSCVNRDKDGSPKEAFFGGTPRARISSQALKHALRTSEHWQEAFPNLLSIQTRTLPAIIRENLLRKAYPLEGVEAITQAVMTFGKSGKKEEGNNEAEKAVGVAKTDQVVKISPAEIAHITDQLVTAYEDGRLGKLGIARVLTPGQFFSVDMALFGRMTTASGLNTIQASSQMAHALGVNQLYGEIDYYVASDDVATGGGAGFIQEAKFNSSTFYCYANIDTRRLADNLGGDNELAAKAIKEFLFGFAALTPGGKQNSYGAFGFPDVIVVEVLKRNIPISYMNAFQSVIKGTGTEPIISQATKRLFDYMADMDVMYGLVKERKFLCTGGNPASVSLDKLMEWVSDNDI
ncbi:MAG TPA: type I-E CRISPR-associated protein Cas7/Cse4/CasC [Myxococcota bacterium]|nr:type I-E CRISPR-associated protein Cas7/Cse4/CasC [Myxococcota bacterium]HRV18706.1 type I-E CRISPR-associated protein Cas7/Cse4/CasC [Myxococcota bacterium]